LAACVGAWSRDVSTAVAIIRWEVGRQRDLV
jgi:hypothetical protein